MESNQNMPKPVSFAELKHCIESHKTYIESIAKGKTHGMCGNFSIDYSLAFHHAGIDFVQLDSDEHTFLAVRTSDRGTLIFDPTFTQLFPHHPERYFLDSPEALLTLLNKNGLDETLLDYGNCQPPLTVRNSFLGVKIRAPYYPMDTDPQIAWTYMQQWVDELRPLAPTSHLTLIGVRRLEMNQARSSSELSP